MVLYWSHYIFIGVNVISFPLYSLIIIICIKEYKHNPSQRAFYLLFISQGLMDTLVMASYFIFGILRLSELLNSLFWTYRDYYVAAWSFNQTYVSAIFRCFGVLVISFQKYISLCKSENQRLQLINTSYRWVSVILQWTVPMVYSIPLLLFSDPTFKGSENMEVLVEHKHITIATSMTAVFVTTTFLLCSFCYVNILKYLINNRFALCQALKRERRLYAQMMGLFVGFVLLFVFYVLMFSFSLRTDNSPIFTMRIIFPLINCFFSYINPWMMLILNVDMRRKVLSTVGQVAARKVSLIMATPVKAMSAVVPTRF
uniref:G_PROTEIN_RECEP_F1_2 domain-containing protein n=1 Tax=Haemonchus contortus TaxID=6289 RepID=A0A7I4YHB0_HAECO